MRVAVLAVALLALAPLAAAQDDSAVPSAPTGCEPGDRAPDATNCPPGTDVPEGTGGRVTEDDPVPQEAVGAYDMARLAVIGGALVVLSLLVGVAWWRTRDDR